MYALKITQTGILLPDILLLKMKVEYIAFDSFGVKSSCVLVTTADCSICIDPGIAEEVNSFPLPLWKRLALVIYYKKKIIAACKKADIITISHYHYDHVIPEPNLYRNKILLVKDPKKNINKSQKGRAAELLPQIKANIKKYCCNWCWWKL